MCPKGEEGLTLTLGPRSSDAHSGTSVLSTLTFHPPCELRTTGQGSPTSGLHTSPFFSPSLLPSPTPLSQQALGGTPEACWESGGNVEHLVRAQASPVGSY